MCVCVCAIYLPQEVGVVDDPKDEEEGSEQQVLPEEGEEPAAAVGSNTRSVIGMKRSWTRCTRHLFRTDLKGPNGISNVPEEDGGGLHHEGVPEGDGVALHEGVAEEAGVEDVMHPCCDRDGRRGGVGKWRVPLINQRTDLSTPVGVIVMWVIGLN